LLRPRRFFRAFPLERVLARCAAGILRALLPVIVRRARRIFQGALGGAGAVLIGSMGSYYSGFYWGLVLVFNVLV